VTGFQMKLTFITHTYVIRLYVSSKVDPICSPPQPRSYQIYKDLATGFCRSRGGCRSWKRHTGCVQREEQRLWCEGRLRCGPRSMAFPARAHLGLLVLIVCMAARACGSGLPAGGAATAAVPVAPAAMGAGVPTPAPVAAEGATLAPEILEPQHVEEAAPVEEATGPGPEPVEEEHAAAEAVPRTTAVEESRAASPSADAGVAEGGEAKAPSATGWGGLEAEARGAMASIEEVLMGAGFEVAGKPEAAEKSEAAENPVAEEVALLAKLKSLRDAHRAHRGSDEEAALRTQEEAALLKRLKSLRDALRGSFNRGMSQKGNTTFEGVQRPSMPKMMLRRPGASDDEVEAQRQELELQAKFFMKLHGTVFTPEDEATASEETETEGAAPQKGIKEMLLERLAENKEKKALNPKPQNPIPK